MNFKPSLKKVFIIIIIVVVVVVVIVIVIVIINTLCGFWKLYMVGMMKVPNKMVAI